MENDLQMDIDDITQREMHNTTLNNVPAKISMDLDFLILPIIENKTNKRNMVRGSNTRTIRRHNTITTKSPD
jgi:hypothetical protein